MRKVIASINVTFDGFCDHTSGIANPELHDHFTALLNNAGTVLYGRTTYQLMEDFWPTLISKPTGDAHMDDFAAAIDKVEKILFSRTVQSVGWRNSRLATKDLKTEVLGLRQQTGKDIVVGSPSLILQLTQLKLIDEYQLVVHPVITSKGLRLFEDLAEPVSLTLLKTETLKTAGHVIFYYTPVNE